MAASKTEFLDFIIDCGVLRFGEFTLKSGRRSPYFFNAGLFNSGTRLRRLGAQFARALVDSGLGFDTLYGPAYKGIALAAATAIALDEEHGRDVPYCYNRKEAKDHGEGGLTVGAPLQGRVVIVDDVISAGTSVRESVGIIRAAGAEPAGVLIALDRQERGAGPSSAVAEVREQHGIPVVSVLCLGDLVDYLGRDPARAEELAAIANYREQYGFQP